MGISILSCSYIKIKQGTIHTHACSYILAHREGQVIIAPESTTNTQTTQSSSQGCPGAPHRSHLGDSHRFPRPTESIHGSLSYWLVLVADLLVVVAARRITAVEFDPLFEQLHCPKVGLGVGLSWGCRHVAAAGRIPAAVMASLRRAHVPALAGRPAGYNKSPPVGAVMRYKYIGQSACVLLDLEPRILPPEPLPPCRYMPVHAPLHPLRRLEVSIGPQTCASRPACSPKLHQLSFAGRFCDLVEKQRKGVHKKKQGGERKWLF